MNHRSLNEGILCGRLKGTILFVKREATEALDYDVLCSHLRPDESDILMVGWPKGVAENPGD